MARLTEMSSGTTTRVNDRNNDGGEESSLVWSSFFKASRDIYVDDDCAGNADPQNLTRLRTYYSLQPSTLCASSQLPNPSVTLSLDCGDSNVNVSPGTALPASPFLGASSAPCFLFVHGAGLSAMSWALCANLLYSKGFSVFTIDLRAHGESQSGQESLLSLERATMDFVTAYNAVMIEEEIGGREDFSANSGSSLQSGMQQLAINPSNRLDVVNQTSSSSHSMSSRKLYIVGHSFGAAVAVSIASRKLIGGILGVVVVDAVEGTALESLSSMPGVISSRPSEFSSIDDAVSWSVSRGLPRNSDSARISVPQLLKRVPKPARSSLRDYQPGANRNSQNQNECSTNCYVWRTNLLETHQHWRGWFEGMTAAFLNSPCARMLVIAKDNYTSINPLDTPLTIAQMQGKFQHTALPNCGHHVHEDQPVLMAELLTEFAKRNMPIDIAAIRRRQSENAEN